MICTAAPSEPELHRVLIGFHGVPHGRSDQAHIIMIMADDVGIWNISAYHRGMMGGSTPNIDRLAREGALFTGLLRPAVLHRRARGVHHRADTFPYRSAQGRPAGGETGPAGFGPDNR